MKAILAPIDFSPVSKNAARYAAKLAAAIKGELMLLHIVQMPVTYGEIPMPISSYDEILDQAKHEMHLFVKTLSTEMNNELPIHYDIKVGSPLYEIIQEAAERKPLLLVMGTRGLGSLERFLLGSTTLSTVKECGVPVLVIPEDQQYQGIRRLGLASDFHEVVEKTPDQYINHLLDILHAELHIIHNNPDYHEYEPAVMEEGLLLDTMFSRAKHRFHFLHNEFNEESIINFAEDHDLDWLMIIPKKHGFFDELFGHQHTREFVLHATLPILVLSACPATTF